jgi:hypothetical protein
MSTIRKANRALIGHQSKGHTMANTNPPQEIIATKVPADNRYGQNSYQGPSSVTPGQRQPTSSLKATPDDPVKDLLAREGFKDQTRKIDTEQHLPTTHGMRNPNANPTKIAAKTHRG